VVTAGWLLIVAGMFVCPSYLLHAPMPPQTLNATYTLFVLGWITAVIVWTGSSADVTGAKAISSEADGPRFARSAALAVLGLSLLVTGNTCTGITGLRNGVPQNWKRMNQWRDHLIREAEREGATQVELPIRDLAAGFITNYSSMYVFCDISDDPSYWVNSFVAHYYGLKAVRRVPPTSRLSARPDRRIGKEVVGVRPNDGSVKKR
jgi:hypothetical protein